ncbi:Phosphotransferase enzyme family protein [Terribacillus aidingensis]|uniref:Phosphotransferase enzyme family protein n=1 Tax=Terribacillus aidingensis TaxID=586416 RepID=A0A285N955_9BACI|nr:phosphotransferase [Terribacillus aidingensis]SNZ05950.1 Phosphotransferase enzyme family protein [Terribacillus aidingensis]
MDVNNLSWLEVYVEEPIKHIETNDTGWDHQVYIINQRWILRVPRNKRRIPKEEGKLLKDLLAKTTVALPTWRVCTTADGREGMLYPYIPGRPIHARMSESDLKQAARQLGSFLTELHRVTVTYKLPRRDKTYYDRFLNQIRTFYPKLPAGAADYTEQLFNNYQPVCSTVVHGDLRPAHLLVEQPFRKLGVLDFSDMHIGDPAIDFAGTAQVSKEFMELVLENYKGEEKNVIRQRVTMLSKLSLYYQLLERGPASYVLAELERQITT